LSFLYLRDEDLRGRALSSGALEDRPIRQIPEGFIEQYREYSCRSIITGKVTQGIIEGIMVTAAGR